MPVSHRHSFLVIAIRGQIWRSIGVGACSAPWTEAAISHRPPGLGKKQKRPVQLKRKETWDFPNLRGLALRLAETITRIRSSWSHRDPGSFQTWARVLGQQGWPSRGLLPQSPRLQTNSQEDKCLPPKGFRTSQSSPLTLAPTHALPSGVGVVARGWGVRPPEAGSEHN